MRQLLLSEEPVGSLERNWNWRNSAEKGVPIEATLAARGYTYNGHPVSAGYVLDAVCFVYTCRRL